jgi:hypothetical protein
MVLRTLNTPVPYNQTLKKFAKSGFFNSSPMANNLLPFLMQGHLYLIFAFRLLWFDGCHVALKIHLAFEPNA